MSYNSQQAIIAKYTDISRYRPEYIYGNVYVDEKRVKEALKNDIEKEKLKIEIEIADKFAKNFDCKVFMLPPTENGDVIYKEKNSNPDFISYNMFLEIKRPKGTKTSIRTRFQESVHQADGVLISIQNNIPINVAKKWIEEKLQLMNNHDGFVVVIESMNNYGLFTVKEKGLKKAPF